uniref:Methylmalonyl-CoA mutase homolog n=1 Tax=Alkalihalophilus pseudofirmus (strain ATCC BAA-2126 / JCM 17055 / OF4) TaxID=398511 RepID=MUTX_ALKPO|nr:RecName: Full=Methylmalonyl-CoA mutase homolog [Alkalihalophilus pseudofirmus OF4]CAA42057.1 homologue of methylmalonyl CoA mutase [Cytobacillus firmus]
MRNFGIILAHTYKNRLMSKAFLISTVITLAFMLVLTNMDPYVNMLRGTSEAFSAAVAGADSIQVSPFDEPIQPSTSFSRRIARNTSLILMEESHLAATQDASGGAWYVEHLTDEIIVCKFKVILILNSVREYTDVIADSIFKLSRGH